MKRGVPAGALPPGVRQDTRKHTKHCLRPTPALVTAYLGVPSDTAWEVFREGYERLVSERFAADPGPFVLLADRAREADVHLGCSCPTKANPDVNHCHTVLALRFMAKQFPGLDVRLPA